MIKNVKIEKINLIVGLIEGIETVREESCWNGGIDSSVQKNIKNVDVVRITLKKGNDYIYNSYLVLNDKTIEFNQFDRENSKKIYDYFMNKEEE